MTWILAKGISTALIVGQAPARHDDPNCPITGRTGRRLADLMGMPFEQYLCTFDRANLLDEWPGYKGGFRQAVLPKSGGDAFPREEAKRSAASLWGTHLGAVTCEYDYVLLLGRGVDNAFRIGHAQRPWMEWLLIMPQALHVAVLPHPSGVNRWWNDAFNVEAARKFLTEWRKTVEGQGTEASVLDRGSAG